MSEQRLIDANRLIDFIDCGHLRNPLELCFSESEVVNMLDSAPTIPAEVVPVVRGEWVLVGTNEHDYETSVEEKCSLCGRYVYRYDTQPQDNYCPNCGAKIGKETNNERND